MKGSLSLQQILQAATARLAAAGVENPVVDARILAAAALGCDRALLLTRLEMADAEAERFMAMIDRRARHEPVARILGVREFWGLPLLLNEATLEPRPDSETLVETALKQYEKQNALRVLDLGTGTGALLLALLSEWPRASGLGRDIAPRAVEQARENAERVGLSARAAFEVGDWLEGLSARFDVIVCNPPYIATHEKESLMPEVRDYDPALALYGGPTGLEVYDALIPQLGRFLNGGGRAFFEVGHRQAARVRALFEKNGFQDVQDIKDLAGIPRCVCAAKGSPRQGA